MYTMFHATHHHTYPLWKTHTIVLTNPAASSSLADEDDSACLVIPVPSASSTSQPKTPSGSDVSDPSFSVWASSASILSTSDSLGTQIKRASKQGIHRTTAVVIIS